MISRRYLYKIESVDDRQVVLNVAKVHSSYAFPPEPRHIMSGILTGWRMLFTGLGYHELPIRLDEAHQLYLAAPTYERMATLYANYCPHNEQVGGFSYMRARSGLRKTMWAFGGRFFKGGREWIAWSAQEPSYALMAVGHVFDHKERVRDETEDLLTNFKATLLDDGELPAARISFDVKEAALIHFMRPGMVWEYTDETECPHCLSNAPYFETGRERQVGTLATSIGSNQMYEMDIRQCQCSLCGGEWNEDHSFYII